MFLEPFRYRFFRNWCKQITVVFKSKENQFLLDNFVKICKMTVHFLWHIFTDIIMSPVLIHCPQIIQILATTVHMLTRKTNWCHFVKHSTFILHCYCSICNRRLKTAILLNISYWVTACWVIVPFAIDCSLCYCSLQDDRKHTLGTYISIDIYW